MDHEFPLSEQLITCFVTPIIFKESQQQLSIENESVEITEGKYEVKHNMIWVAAKGSGSANLGQLSTGVLCSPR